jgi:hypothetical protein
MTLSNARSGLFSGSANVPRFNRMARIKALGVPPVTAFILRNN